MAETNSLNRDGAEKDRPARVAKERAIEATMHGKQPHDIVMKANMKRQQKHGHQKDGK